jgi:hypothetical protein
MIKEAIIQSLQGTLNSSSILIIKMHLESIQDIDAKISELDQTNISTDTFIITYPPYTEYGTMGQRMAEGTERPGCEMS